MTNQELQILKNKYDIIGNDPALNRALEVAVSVAPTDITVLVTGESGVGKENIPRIIHQNSPRKRGKYFAINCGAIPEGTVDSELFGHEKGSFTGAVEMRRGYFEEADGGTLFLDEIGELPMETQAKLLRVLQSGEFIRVGSSKVLKSDVRVIAATNVDLLNAVSRGKFRADLYFRLNSVVIQMPALRDRPADINLLFRKFASDFSAKYGMAKVSLTEDAAIMLRKYRWPGNIRQLKNIAEAVSALESSKIAPGADKCIIDAEVLSRYIPKEEPNLPVLVQQQENLETLDYKFILMSIVQLRQDVDYLKRVMESAGLEMRKSLPVPLPEPPEEVHDWPPTQDAYDEIPEDQDPEDQDPEDTDPEDVAPEQKTMKEVGLELIEKTLQKHNNNRKAAAKELGISERTIYRKIAEIKKKK